MRTDRVHLRLAEPEKTSWEKAAKRDGFMHNGEANVSGWLRSLANRQVAKPVKLR